NSIRVNVRIIAATNQHLPTLIAENRFREDLYYRLNVVPIHLPALRERSDDVPLLARHFLELAANEGLPRKTLGEDAIRLLVEYHWPGNVRELQNLMQRLAVLSREDVIGANIVRQILPAGQPGEGRSGESVERLRGAVRDWAKSSLGRSGIGSIPAVDEDVLHQSLLSVVEPVLLRETLLSVDGKQIKAAQVLGINRNTRRKKLNDYGLDPA